MLGSRSPQPQARLCHSLSIAQTFLNMEGVVVSTPGVVVTTFILSAQEAGTGVSVG